MPATLRDDVSLNETIRKLWAATISHNTRRAYQTGLNRFLLFMTMYGFMWPLNGLPVFSEDILIYFVAHCFHSLTIRYSTIKLYLCGIRFMYLERGIVNPLGDTSTPLLRLEAIVRAVKKVQGVSTFIRLPITVPILSQIITYLERGIFSVYEDILVQTMCSLAFFAFLRCGEITCDQFDSTLHLTLSSIAFAVDNSYFTITLKASKTDPFRQGITIYVFKVNNSVCPVALMQKYLKIRYLAAAHNSDPLFVTPGRQVVTRIYFIDKIKILLSRLGYDPKLYSGHSFRIGAATTAGKANLPDYLIKTLGRWSSDCYLRYIRTPVTCLQQAQINMSNLCLKQF